MTQAQKSTLPARISSLQTNKQLVPSSPISHLHTLFQDNLQYDPLRCLQGWRLLCEEEWRPVSPQNQRNTRNVTGGFNVRDVGEQMKEWIGMVIKGVYLYDEQGAEKNETQELSTEERIDSALNGTKKLLKKTIQRQQQDGDNDSLIQSHLMSETVLFRNMSGEKYKNVSLRNSLRRSMRATPNDGGQGEETASTQEESFEQDEITSQHDESFQDNGDEFQNTEQFETHIIREDTNLLQNDNDLAADDEPSVLREISEEVLVEPSTQFAAYITPQQDASDSDDDENRPPQAVKTSGNPFYQILKEFIELACVPLQMNKSSDVLLKTRKYAELLDILGYVCMNCIQWETIAVRSLRAIRHIFYRCSMSTSAPEGSVTAQTEQASEQNALLTHSRITYYVYYTLLLFQKYALSADSSNVASSSLENVLAPKTVDLLSELLFLLKDYSSLREGARIIASNQMLIPLMEFSDMTTIVRKENAPLYLHMIVEIVWNTMMSISNYERVIEQVTSASKTVSLQATELADTGVFTLSALRKKRATKLHLPPLTNTRPLSAHSENSTHGSANAPLISFRTEHLVTMDPSDVSSLLSSLLSLFRDLLQNATKQTDHYLKNDILVICSLFASHPDYKPLFRDIGFIEDICLFFQKEVSEEQNTTRLSTTGTFSSPNASHRNKYSPPHYYSEMIILMWHLLSSLAFDSNSLELMLQEGILAIILNYVDLTCNDLHCISKWSEDQLKDIRLQALQSLFFFSELSAEAFCANAGCETLLELLSYLNQSEYEHQPSNGAGSLQMDEDVDIMMQKITAVLLNASTTSQGSLELTQKGGFAFLFELAANHDEPNTDNITPFIQRRNDCFEILMWMCKNNPENQMTFHECGGVSKLLGLLNEYNNHSGMSSSLMTQQETNDLMFQLVNCLWRCVVGYEASERAFNRAHGINILLDVMDTNVDFVKFSALGFIGDMLAFPEAREQLSHWVSRQSKRTAVETFAQMWQEENNSTSSVSPSDAVFEAKFGCKRSEIDFKLKLHTVLAQLQYKDHHPRKSISHADKIVLTEVASYGEMLQNKAWASVASELDAEGVRPISPDSGVLRDKNKHLMALEKDVQAKKQSIREKLENHDKRKEQDFFNYIQKLAADHQQEKALKAKKVSILEQKRLKDRLFQQARTQQE